MSSVATKIVIDKSKLARRTMLDTGTLLRWLGSIKDVRAPYCKAVADELTGSSQYTILIAAPSIAEMLRWDGPVEPLPKAGGIQVVPFDAMAASYFSRMSMRTIRELSKETGLTVTHLKYDPLIVACALRHDAKLIVSCDEGVIKLAPKVGLRAIHPTDLELVVEPPRQLPLLPQSPSSAPS